MEGTKALISKTQVQFQHDVMVYLAKFNIYRIISAIYCNKITNFAF